MWIGGELMELVHIMKALSDETRMRIINLLSKGELCVCEIEYLLDINQSNASRHLNKLTTAKIITYEKRALYVYYKINREILEKYSFINELISDGFKNESRFENDIADLAEYKKSGLSCENLRQGKSCTS